MSLAVETDTTVQPSPVNRFGYFVGRIIPAFTPSTVTVEGQPLAVTACQPQVPQTRGQKTIVYNAQEQQMALTAATQPAPPRRAPIHWQQTRLEAPAALGASRSRTDMLSEKIARQS